MKKSIDGETNDPAEYMVSSLHTLAGHVVGADSR